MNNISSRSSMSERATENDTEAYMDGDSLQFAELQQMPLGDFKPWKRIETIKTFYSLDYNVYLF